MKWSSLKMQLLGIAKVVMAIFPIGVSVVVSSAQAGSLTKADHRRLDHLLRHDCGSCHGMTMKGGLGPALSPEALHERDDDSLVEMILSGNPEYAMPAWRGLLELDEARWIVRHLKNGLPKIGQQP